MEQFKGLFWDPNSSTSISGNNHGYFVVVASNLRLSLMTQRDRKRLPQTSPITYGQMMSQSASKMSLNLISFLFSLNLLYCYIFLEFSLSYSVPLLVLSSNWSFRCIDVRTCEIYTLGIVDSLTS